MNFLIFQVLQIFWMFSSLNFRVIQPQKNSSISTAAQGLSPKGYKSLDCWKFESADFQMLHPSDSWISELYNSRLVSPWIRRTFESSDLGACLLGSPRTLPLPSNSRYDSFLAVRVHGESFLVLIGRPTSIVKVLKR